MGVHKLKDKQLAKDFVKKWVKKAEKAHQLDKQWLRDQKILAKYFNSNRVTMRKTTEMLKKYNDRAEKRIKRMNALQRK